MLDLSNASHFNTAMDGETKTVVIATHETLTADLGWTVDTAALVPRLPSLPLSVAEFSRAIAIASIDRRCRAPHSR